MEKTVAELFAGVGGFRVGLNHVEMIDMDGRAIENGEWNFVWANQWEPSTRLQHAYDCYCTRFGKNNHHSNVDIALVNKEDIPDHNLLVGGFPCQDYSVARSLSGEKGIEGKKGVLFWQIAKTLEVKAPSFVLLENVDRLLKSPSKQRGRDFGIMLRTFNDLGYNVEWRVVNAAEYGMPQRRRRVYIFAWKRTTEYNHRIIESTFDDIILHYGIFASAFPLDIDLSVQSTRNEFIIDTRAYKDRVEMTEAFQNTFYNSGVMTNGTVRTFKTFPIEEQQITLRMILDNQTDLTQFYLNNIQEHKFKVLRSSKKKKRIRPDGTEYYYSEGSMSSYDNLDLPGRTMLTSESTVTRSTHIIQNPGNNLIRFITPIEAERMQMFPDDWTNTGMPLRRRYFMMGNALVTGIVSRLEPYLSEIFENEPED